MTLKKIKSFQKQHQVNNNPLILYLQKNYSDIKGKAIIFNIKCNDVIFFDKY